MTELTKNTKAERSLKRLEKLRKRKITRWRPDTAPVVWCVLAVVGALVAAVISIGATDGVEGYDDSWSMPLALMWSIYGAVFGGSALLFGLERGTRNLYERIAIYRAEKPVKQFRESGDIFSVPHNLDWDWRNAVTDAGGDANHPSVAPQEHWAVFNRLVELERMREHNRTSDERLGELEEAKKGLIDKTIKPLVDQMKLESVREETEDQLHDMKVQQLIESTNEWPG